MPVEILLCSNDNTTDENNFIEGLEWSLDRYLGFKESKIRRARRTMTKDLGYGINIDQMIEEMNSRNCFNFDFNPLEKDRLLIYNNHKGRNYKYFGLIHSSGKWIQGDYYSTKLPVKGKKIILENIAKGRIKRTHNK